MKKYLSDTWVVVALVALMICAIGIGLAVYRAFFPWKQVPDETGQLMAQSQKTTVEFKKDNNISEIFVTTADPVFNNVFSHSGREFRKIDPTGINMDDWECKVTYQLSPAANTYSVVCLLGENWFMIRAEEDTVYQWKVQSDYEMMLIQLYVNLVNKEQ